MNSIPRKIHVTLKDKSTPGMYKVFLDSMRDVNPDWELILYDDEDASTLVRQYYPYLSEVYNAFPTNIQRMDIFRLLVVYLHGGFYMDADMYCMKNLGDLTSRQLVLAEEKTLSDAQCRELGHAHPMRIANYMFGGVANHPFMAEWIIAALRSITHPVSCEMDVLETTGPGLLTNLYHLHKNNYPDIKLLHNDTMLCLKQCSEGASCHFGEYAVHLHMGSWRWEGTPSHPIFTPPVYLEEATIEDALQQFRERSVFMIQ